MSTARNDNKLQLLTRNQMFVLGLVADYPGCYAGLIDRTFAAMEGKLGVRLFRDAHKTLGWLENKGLTTSEISQDWNQAGHPPRLYRTTKAGNKCLEENYDLAEVVASTYLDID